EQRVYRLVWIDAQHAKSEADGESERGEQDGERGEVRVIDGGGDVDGGNAAERHSQGGSVERQKVEEFGEGLVRSRVPAERGEDGYPRSGGRMRGWLKARAMSGIFAHWIHSLPSSPHPSSDAAGHGEEEL